MSDLEKTEEATPRRRSDAHEKGQVPRSVELNTAVLLAASALVLNVVGTVLGRNVHEVFGFGLASAGTVPIDAETAVELVRRISVKVLAGVSAFAGALALVGAGVAGVQARGVLTLKPLAPNWGKMNPLANSKRIFGAQSLAELLKSLLKLLIVGLAVYSALGSAWGEMLGLIQRDPIALLHVARRYSVRLLVVAGGAYLGLAILDYVYQIWQHEKGLRMTKEEVKQETKQAEVDPMIRQRMRSAARGRIRRQMFEEVATADVVVTNPTHIAVALRYQQGRDEAPLVVAMGQEKMAARIRGLADEAGVPRVENKPLARALYSSARVGQTIPPELYAAVIEVYVFIVRQRQAGAPTRRS